MTPKRILRLFTSSDFYAPPQQLVRYTTLRDVVKGSKNLYRAEVMHNAVFELPRIPLPRLSEKSSNAGEPPHHERRIIAAYTNDSPLAHVLS
jgi:hypothetical protein